MSEGMGFELHRQVAYRKYFWKGYFPKPDIPRFYHKLIDLPLDELTISDTWPLLSGCCLIQYRLKIFFQVKLKYIRKTYGKKLVTDINNDTKEHLKEHLRVKVINEISKVDNDSHLLDKLKELQKEISSKVNNFLAEKDINCQASCELKPIFTTGFLPNAPKK
ncbi:MAG: hypothetical protein QG588_2144 [Candidatus Poribacteria bacterium]|nr:hypothetical protein [Candidatus Poribacteria bacterium]